MPESGIFFVEQFIFSEENLEKIGELRMGLLETVAGGKIFEMIGEVWWEFLTVLDLAHFTFKSIYVYIKFYSFVLCFQII